VKQEFPRPQRVVIQSVGLGIGADMSIHKEDLALFDIPVTIPQVDLSLPEGLDLGPKQRNPGLDRLLDRVVMKRLSVLANQLFAHLFYILPKKGFQINELTTDARGVIKHGRGVR
jgi:hypothetical protein